LWNKIRPRRRPRTRGGEKKVEEKRKVGGRGGKKNFPSKKKKPAKASVDVRPNKNLKSDRKTPSGQPHANGRKKKKAARKGEKAQRATNIKTTLPKNKVYCTVAGVKETRWGGKSVGKPY